VTTQLTPRIKLAGTVSFIGAGIAILAQSVATPLVGDLSGKEVIGKVNDHTSGMHLALGLDLPVLVLATCAILFLGHLLDARRSVAGAVAFLLIFVPFLMSIPAIIGLDLLASLTPSPKLIDAWQDSTFFTATLLTYLLTHIVGYIAAAVVLFRSRRVPRWTAIALGIWPIVETVSFDAGKPGLLIAYALLLLAYVGCALSLDRSAPVPAHREAAPTAA
jgi:hypothetical protein